MKNISDISQIFAIESLNANTFYKEYGFIHYRPKSVSFSQKIDKCFKYYSDRKNHENNNQAAFRNKDGKPRHFIDVFRDKLSNALSIYRSNEIQTLVRTNTQRYKRFIFTHSKMSFKQNASDSDWYPHQDNGYKSQGDLREGFAIFVCLEDMFEDNGCLQVFPGSHKLGLFDHSRLIENYITGDNQLVIKNLPRNLQPMSIIAKKGDIIVFSANMVHQSLSSKSLSNRLALIAEIESFDSLKLDDYGKIPIFSVGDLNLLEKSILKVRGLFNPYFYWGIIKSNYKLASVIRKIKYKLN